MYMPLRNEEVLSGLRACDMPAPKLPEEKISRDVLDKVKLKLLKNRMGSYFLNLCAMLSDLSRMNREGSRYRTIRVTS